MPQLIIRGGRVIDPESGLDQTADVLVNDGVIAAIETIPGRIRVDDAAERIDAEGLIVAPGLLDIHVHLRDPGPDHRETIASGAAAAVNGGFTTVCCMPNTQPALDNADAVLRVHAAAAVANMARVFVVGAASAARAGESLANIGTMAGAGAVGFTDDGEAIADAGLMAQVLQTAKHYDRCVMQHCQEPTLTRGSAMNAGPLATAMGLGGWPAVAEVLILERDLRLNQSIGCRYHAQHCTTGECVPLLRRAQAAGQSASGEVSPHHLLLTEAACAGYDAPHKMNPPLRTAADIDQLKRGIAEGVIAVLATDHAPHPPHRKDTDFASAAFGVVGLDCALPLYVKALIEDGVIDWPQLLAMMTINPARVVGLDRRGLGRLAVDGPADLTLIDPRRKWTIDVTRFASTGRNCPFDGWPVSAAAVATVIGGVLRPTSGTIAERSRDRTAVAR